MADKVQVYFASYRENGVTGWSVRLLLMGGDVDEDLNPFDATYDSVSSTGRFRGGPTDPLLEQAVKVNPRYDLEVWIPSGHHTENNLDQEAVIETLENRGHPSVSVETKEVELNSTKHKEKDLLPLLVREARASCWGVSLNTMNYVPGVPITTEEAQELHIKADSSGFQTGAFRYLLCQFGLVSASEVTGAIHHRVRRIVESGTLARIYNEKYKRATDSFDR